MDVFPLGFWSRSIAIRFALYHFQNWSIPTPLHYENHATKICFNENRRPIRYKNWNKVITIRYDENIVLKTFCLKLKWSISAHENKKAISQFYQKNIFDRK